MNILDMLPYATTCKDDVAHWAMYADQLSDHLGDDSCPALVARDIFDSLSADPYLHPVLYPRSYLGSSIEDASVFDRPANADVWPYLLADLIWVRTAWMPLFEEQVRTRYTVCTPWHTWQPSVFHRQCTHIQKSTEAWRMVCEEFFQCHAMRSLSERVGRYPFQPDHYDCFTLRAHPSGRAIPTRGSK